MKTITIKDIRGYRPCYDPAKFLAEDWQGTALDILNLESVPVVDRLWVVLRTELMSERCVRLFAVWSARQVLKNTADPRVEACLDVAQRFATGEATEEERSAAWSAAWSAAESAAWSAAEKAQVDKLKEMILAEEKLK